MRLATLSSLYALQDAVLFHYSRLRKKNPFLVFGAALFLALCFFSWLFKSPDAYGSAIGATQRHGFAASSPTPLDKHIHPVPKLIYTARADFEKTAASQSRTLPQAVREYKRRYKINPPPNFDKWFEFAKENSVQIIDEYDSIYHMLLPFWGLAPPVLRARTKEVLSSDDFLMGILIRNGQVVSVKRGESWQQEAIPGMLQGFVQHLPNMDIAINLHDEARVVLPHDDLARFVQRAKTETIPRAQMNNFPENLWSDAPEELRGSEIQASISSLFNDFRRQFTWTTSRLSCPPDTPARSLNFDGKSSPDQLSAYVVGELGFMYNRTAYTDVCLAPSLADTFGFFNRPNAFHITHELIPIFSPSKVSSFQDILFPNPWNWADRVWYNVSADLDWDQKTEKVYWRGTTSSGFSRNGTWHKQHRQRFVEKVNKPGIVSKIMTRKKRKSAWHVQEVQQRDYSYLFDVHFSLIYQCSDEDCKKQEEYFGVMPKDDYDQNWRFKYLLDIDGNAFSGRFHTFLRSKSLTFKLTMFREWHDEWIKPWVHYVPWTIRGEEHLESLRYLVEEEDGRDLSRQIVSDSSAWAGKVLRRVDMEAWFFRLLLE